MSNEDVIRAWKDEDYCSSLSQERRSQLPDNPAGAIDLSEKEMEIIAGGRINLSRVTHCPENDSYPCLKG
jgi:mersacidin/lichenicidin family type 2 lantibiotic